MTTDELSSDSFGNAGVCTNPVRLDPMAIVAMGLPLLPGGLMLDLSTIRSSRTSHLPDGSRCVSMHDPTGRRGVWYYEAKYDASQGVTSRSITIIAGREGDDAIVQLRVGDLVTAETLDALRECLSVGAWMQEDHGPGIESRRDGSSMHQTP